MAYYVIICLALAALGWAAARFLGKPAKGPAWALTGLLLPLCGIFFMQVVGFASDAMSTGSVSGFPTCDSQMVRKMVVQGIQDSGPGKALHVSVLAIYDHREISSGAIERHCRATVALNIATTPRTATYVVSKTSKNDEITVSVEVE